MQHCASCKSAVYLGARYGTVDHAPHTVTAGHHLWEPTQVLLSTVLHILLGQPRIAVLLKVIPRIHCGIVLIKAKVKHSKGKLYTCIFNEGKPKMLIIEN